MCRETLRIATAARIYLGRGRSGPGGVVCWHAGKRGCGCGEGANIADVLRLALSGRRLAQQVMQRLHPRLRAADAVSHGLSFGAKAKPFSRDGRGLGGDLDIVAADDAHDGRKALAAQRAAPGLIP